MNDKVKIAYMDKFGGSGGSVEIDWSATTSLDQLPKNMRVKADQVKDEATYANFVCWADREKIDVKYVVGVSGFGEDELAEIVAGAKRLGMYDELADGFVG